LTLVDAVYPRTGVFARDLVREAVLILGFAGFVAVCAQVAIQLPWTTVPITGSTFGVLVAGGALGARRGAASMIAYMLMGIVALPVFAPTSGVTVGTWDVHFILPWSGSHYVPWESSRGGYVVGYIPAAFLVGYLTERLQWDRKPWVYLGMFLGNVALYIPGVLWLAYLIGSGWIHPSGKPLADLVAPTFTGTWDKALIGGLYPFIAGDLMKLFLASLTLPVAWALVNRVRRQ
jgi:biotin transport system substrate-specific component